MVKKLKCLVCNKALGKAAYKIQCMQCKNWAHLDCASEDKDWICSSCNDEESSTEDESSTEEDPPPASSKSKKKFTINDIMKKLEKIDSKHEKILAKMDELIKENASLKNEIKILKTKQEKLEKQSENSNIEINKTKQEKLCKNAIISGLGKENDNDYQKLVNKIGDFCNVKIKSTDIEYVQKMGKDDTKPLIKVVFTSEEAKEKLMSAYKIKKGVKREDIGQQGNENIFINHDMTLDNQIMFKKARDLKKELNFKFAWFNKGKILMRKEEGSKIEEVDSEDSLVKIKAKNLKLN